MGFLSVGQMVPYPNLLPLDANALFISNYVLNTSGNKLAYVFQAPASGTLDKVAYSFSTVTVGASTTLRTSFQSIDVSGNPYLTQDQYYDNYINGYTNTYLITGSLTNTGQAGGSQRQVNRGDWVAVVSEFGNFNTSDTISIPQANINGYSRLTGEEHLTSYTLSSKTWAQNFEAPCISIKYTDGKFYPFLQGCVLGTSTSIAYNSFASNSNPNEIGLIFQLPFPCQIGGAAFFGYLSSSSSDYTWTLYDANSNILTSYKSLGLRHTGISTKTYRANIFPQLINLLPNTTYYLTLSPNTTNNINVLYDNYATNNLQQAKAPFLPSWQFVQRYNGGAWSQQTYCPYIYLLLAGLPAGAMLPTSNFNGGILQ